MGDYNPFTNKKQKEYELVPRGQYQGELLEVKTKKGKNKDGEECDKIQFTFGIEVDGKPARVFKTCYPARKLTSQFILTLRSIAPDSFDESLVNDDTALWQFTKDLVGRHVLMYVTINGQWNNIESMSAVFNTVPKAAAPKAAVVAPVEQEDLFAVKPPVDDIPF